MNEVTVILKMTYYRMKPVATAMYFKDLIWNNPKNISVLKSLLA